MQSYQKKLTAAAAATALLAAIGAALAQSDTVSPDTAAVTQTAPGDTPPAQTNVDSHPRQSWDARNAATSPADASTGTDTSTTDDTSAPRADRN